MFVWLGGRCRGGVILLTLLAIAPRLLTGDVELLDCGQLGLNLILRAVYDQDTDEMMVATTSI